MISIIIFDLSEVLIYGLLGIEYELSKLIPFPKNEILNFFGGKLLEEICKGNISEDIYLENIIKRNSLPITSETLKTIIRNNFRNEVEGSIQILERLSFKYELILLSDHAREWISYINTTHNFFRFFKRTFYSYEFGKTKKSKELFVEVLKELSYMPSQCLFIDDSVKNIENAEAVGMQGIHFINANKLKKELIRKNIKL